MDYTPITINTNLEALEFLISYQIYFRNIIVAVNNAGSYVPENKLYFYTFYDLVTKKKYSLSAYEIFYAKRRMFLYTTEAEYYSDPIVKQYIQAYENKFEILQNNNYIYVAFYTYYQMALYYSSVLSNIFNSITYKNIGKISNFEFIALSKYFPNIPVQDIKKKYSNQEIYFIYKKLNRFYR
jgi:hypothetical protein